MSNPKSFHFNLDTGARLPGVSLSQEWYPGVQNFWARSTSKRSVGDHITDIVAIVIHATAGTSSAGAVSGMNAKPGGQATSFHWLVPDEDESHHGKLVWACVWEQDATWHVRSTKSQPEINKGQTRVNHCSLGIGIANRQSGGDSFSGWQIAVTAEIVRYCWAKYPHLKYIISDAKLNPDRRNNPGPNFPRERFKQLFLGGVSPLETIDRNILTTIAGSALERWQAASLEEEEANYKSGGSETEKLHATKSMD